MVTVAALADVAATGGGHATRARIDGDDVGAVIADDLGDDLRLGARSVEELAGVARPSRPVGPANGIG